METVKNKENQHPNQGHVLILATVLGTPDDPKDSESNDDNDPTIPQSDQGDIEGRREDIGPDNKEWQEDQRKEDPHRDKGGYNQPQVDPINRPRDNI